MSHGSEPETTFDQTAGADERRAAPVTDSRPRRRWRRVLLVFVVAVIATLVALFLLRNWIVRVVLPPLAGPLIGVDLTLDEVAIGLDGAVSVRGLRAANPRDWTPIRELDVPELRVVVSWRDLARLDLDAVLEVHTAGVIADIDLRRSSLKPAPLEGTSVGETELELPIRLPLLRVGVERLRVSGPEFEVALAETNLESTEDRSSAHVETRVTWKARERSGTHEVSIDVGYADGILSPVRLTLDGDALVTDGCLNPTKLDATLDLQLGGGPGRVEISQTTKGAVQARVELEAVNFESLTEGWLGSPGFASGTAKISFRTNLSLDAPLDAEGYLRLSLRDIEVERARIDALDVTLRLGKRRARLHNLFVSAHGVEARSAHLELTFAEENPGASLQSLGGEIVLTSADLSSAVAAFASEDAAWRGLAIRMLRDTSLDTRLRFNGTEISTSSLVIDAGAWKAELGSSTIEIEPDSLPDSRVNARIGLSIRDAQRLGEMLNDKAPALRGEFSASLSALGPLKALAFEGKLTGSDVHVNELPLGTLSCRLEGIRSDISASLKCVSDVLSAEAQLRIFPEAHRLEKATLSARATHLEPLLVAFPGQLENHGELLAYSDLELTAQANGELSWPDAELSLRALHPGFETNEGAIGPTARPTHLRITKKGDAISLVASELVAPGLIVDLDASTTVTAGLQQFEIGVEHMALRGDYGDWKNRAVSHVTLDATRELLLVNPPLELEGPLGSVRVAVEQQEGDGASGFNASLEAVFPGELPDAFARECVETTGLEIRIKADSTHPLLALRRGALSGSLDVQVRAKAVTATAPIDAHAEQLEFALALELPPAGMPYAELTVDAQVLQVASLPGIEMPREPHSGELHVAIDWRERRAEILQLNTQLGAVDFESTGGITFPIDIYALIDDLDALQLDDAKLDLHVDSRCRDLAMLRPSLPNLRRLAGGMKISGRITGSLEHPIPDLVMKIEDAEARLSDVPTINSVTGEVRLEGDGVTVDFVRGELGGAPFSIRGTVLDLRSDPVVDLTLEGKNLLLTRTGSMRLRSDANLKLTGSLQEVSVTGSLRVTEGKVLQDIPLIHFLTALTRRVGSLPDSGVASSAAEQKAASVQLFRLSGPPIETLRFDVDVSAAEPIELQSGVFRGKARPQVKLLGTGEVPYLVGTVFLEDLVLSLPATRLTASSGAVRFDERYPLVPELLIAATTRIRGYDIHVNVSGRINELEVVFSSTPPLPADQLVAFVATGKPPAGTGPDSQRKALFTVAKYLGSDLVRSLFGSDIDADESVLDRFELDIGRDVSRSGNETWEAKFRLTEKVLTENDTLYLTGDRDAFDHYNIGLRITFRGL